MATRNVTSLSPPPRQFHDSLQPPPPPSPTRSVASNDSNAPDARHLKLIAASLKNSESLVREILDDDPDWTSDRDRDALRQSLQKVAGRGNANIARLLLERGADTEPRGEKERPALYKAAEAGHVNVVASLLRHGANPNVRARPRYGQTPLFIACLRGHNGVVEQLLTAGADVNLRDKEGRTPLLYMMAEREDAKWSQETLRLLLGSRGGGGGGGGDWPLLGLAPSPTYAGASFYDAGILDHVPAFASVRASVPASADVDIRDNNGRTPLIWAVTNSYQDAAEALLNGSMGGKIADVSVATNRGRSALHMAAESNRPAMVRLLIAKNAEVNAISDGGWTALHNAAQEGHHEIVGLLLKAGANANAVLSNGMTPLHWAAFKGHQSVVNLLFDHAETVLDLKDSFDRTPMLCAAERGHGDIVQMLSPAKIAGRLSEEERLACQAFDATVIDFGNFRDDKKHLVSRPSVYDVLYGWDTDIYNSNDGGRPTVTTKAKNIRYKPDFRWIHLPANNIAWAETLLSKWFIEGGHSDVEHFKSLSRCFYQEHRGPFAHSNYMRTYCDRFPAFHEQESFVSSFDGSERPFHPVPEESSSFSARPSIAVTGTDNAPLTPNSNGFHDGGEGWSQAGSTRADKGLRQKRKTKNELTAERHPRRGNRGRGPPGNLPGTKAKNAPKLPELNGKIVLFMPYLHYETEDRRKLMREVIDGVFSGGKIKDLGPTPDIMLTQAYLTKTPPLHPRRTLDQFFYRVVDTATRDTDQVVSRYCKWHKLEKKVFMVDQLWLWILGKDLVVTCFPQRWDQPSRDPFNVLDGIIEETNAKTRPPLQSVYDLALLITGRCAGMFDRHRLSDHDYHFLDMFESSIGLVTDTESALFRRFNEASTKSALWLNQSVSSPNQHERSSLANGKTTDEDQDSTPFTKADFPDALLDIGTETALLAEIKDIRDELNILNSVLSAQKTSLANFERKITDELASGDGGAASASAKPIIAEICKHSGDQLQLLDTHCDDINRMFKQSESIYISLTNLLDLKQKHSNALEARYARESATISARQGQTVLTFTIVTILFLPMSFITSFFSIQLKDLQDKLSVGYVAKYTFGIGLGISIPLIIMAFTVRDVYNFLRGALHDVYAAVQNSGNVPSLVSKWTRATARKLGGDGDGDGVVEEKFNQPDSFGGRKNQQTSQPYSRDGMSSRQTKLSQGYARSAPTSGGQEALRRLSSNVPWQPLQLPRSQHQLQDPPSWLMTGGSSTIRGRLGSSSAAPSRPSREPRGGDGGGDNSGFVQVPDRNRGISSSAGMRGWTSLKRPPDVEQGRCR